MNACDYHCLDDAVKSVQLSLIYQRQMNMINCFINWLYVIFVFLRIALHRMELIEVPGKNTRTVPILIPPHILSAMNVLVAHRKDLGRNKYFFATNKTDGHLYSCGVMRNVAKKAGLKQESWLTSTSLRKYIATSAQVSPNASYTFKKTLPSINWCFTSATVQQNIPWVCHSNRKLEW